LILKQIKEGARRVEETLVDDPCHGEALTGIYKGLYKFRIGDYKGGTRY